MARRNILRGLLASALLSVLVYALLAALTDARQVAATLRSFPLSSLAAMVALTLCCYLVRSVRWYYLMRVMGHPMRPADAVYVQLSGMTMTVTPGKVGEVLKGFLARDLTGLPMAGGVSLVFTERLTDVVAVVALSFGAVGLVANGRLALGIAVAALAAGIAVLSSERVHRLALDLAARQSWMRAHHGSAATVSQTIRTVMAPRPLITSVLLSAVAWSCEGTAFWVCVESMGFTRLSAATAIAIYAIATLVGAFTFLPGGIGLTEASIAGLLVATGMASADASAATLLIRVVTLWFGVGLGWLVLASRPAVLRRVLSAGEANGLEEPSPSEESQ